MVMGRELKIKGGSSGDGKPMGQTYVVEKWLVLEALFKTTMLLALMAELFLSYQLKETPKRWRKVVAD